ncbi:MAG: shikimate kinase [Nitrospirae bacterium]|nr:shikimate kinase [Nitrospirota bacterium]
MATLIGVGSNVIFTGFMGAGKTTVGGIVAARLGRAFHDVDVLIEKDSGMSINDIFDRRGEAFFRDEETRMLTRLESAEQAVMATGGGIVLREENWAIMRRMGKVVSLLASADVLYERVKDLAHRPLLKVVHPKDELVRLLGLRAPLYRKADLLIDTDRRTPEDVAATVLRELGLLPKS